MHESGQTDKLALPPWVVGRRASPSSDEFDIRRTNIDHQPSPGQGGFQPSCWALRFGRDDDDDDGHPA